jgi:hypothetical protein
MPAATAKVTICHSRIVDQGVRERRQRSTHGFVLVGVARFAHRLRHLRFDLFGNLATLIDLVDLIRGL